MQFSNALDICLELSDFVSCADVEKNVRYAMSAIEVSSINCSFFCFKVLISAIYFRFRAFFNTNKYKF